MSLSTANSILRCSSTLNDPFLEGIEPGSTAERAGLNPGDVILEINRHNVSAVEDFEKLYRKSTENLLFLIYRKGRSYYLALR